MFKELMNKVKNFFNRETKEEKENEEGKKEKRKIENLAVFLVILIITLIVINSILGENEESSDDENQSAYKELAETYDEEETSSSDELESKLEDILKTMEGVGDVNVLVTYSQSSEVVAMYNETSSSSSTSETDSSGGSRTIDEENTSKEVIFTEENGENVPATQVIVSPKVEGIVVTAEGAENADIKANIIAAVQAVTGVATHKVQVFPMNSK